MRRYSLYIFDLDGTLYRGAQALPYAPEVVSRLREERSLIRFLTNNSSMTCEDQAEKLERMGIRAEPSEVLTSGVGTARYLLDHSLRSAYVVGEEGLVRVLESGGIQVVHGSQPDAVVVGICRSLTYAMLDEALQRILAGAKFVATNADVTYPMEEGRVVPGAGAMVAAVQACSQTEPLVIGKPNPFLVESLLQETGVGPEEALVVGDRYETDIVSGQRAGCATFLVLTGVTRELPEGQAGGPSLLSLMS